MKRTRNVLLVLALVFFISGISWSILAREAFTARGGTPSTGFGMFLFEHIEYEGVPVIISYGLLFIALILTLKDNGKRWVERLRNLGHKS